jgi:trehalose 6-phosphate phosphatase
MPTLAGPVSKLAFLLDVDGTLLDIAPTPSAVRVPNSLRQTLERIDRITNGALALVSGRSLADLDRIFAPVELAAIAGHGAEMRPAKGKTPDRSGGAALPSELRRRLIALTRLGPGIIAEDKGYSLALHYRLAPEYAPAIEQALASIRADFELGTIELLPGKCVIEIKHSEFNKGTAVRRLMVLSPFSGRRPLFLGDDITDESVFAILPEFDGIGFSVGRRVPGVAGHFDSPRQVRTWLAAVAGSAGTADP